MSRRKRKLISYAEDTKVSTSIDNVYDIPSSTSKWNSAHREAMKMSFIDTDNIENIIQQLDIEDACYNKLMLEEWNRENMRTIKDTDISNLINKLSDPAIGTIVSKIRSIIIKEDAANIREAEVDSFMMSLLQYLKFDEWPCFVEPQYHYSFDIIADKHIASVVDFLVTVNRRYILLFVEDKHIGNTGSLIEWSEPQIAGEILGSAFHNMQLGSVGAAISYPIVIFAVRIIGTRFTFYKANVSREYMREVATIGLPDTTELRILRYPKQVSKDILESWDFCDPQDRKKILNTLYALKRYTHNNV